MPADDIIRDLVRQVWKLHPEMTDSELCNFGMQLRAEFGGKEYFVKKKAAAEGRMPSREACAAGERVLCDAVFFSLRSLRQVEVAGCLTVRPASRTHRKERAPEFAAANIKSFR